MEEDEERGDIKFRCGDCIHFSGGTCLFHEMSAYVDDEARGCNGFEEGYEAL